MLVTDLRKWSIFLHLEVAEAQGDVVTPGQYRNYLFQLP